MMPLEIRLARPEDAGALVGGWNRVLVQDPVDEARFVDVIFEDPNHESEDTLVVLDGGRSVGFLDVIARDGIEGRDGRGRAEEAEDAYLRGLYALPEYPADEVLEPLLEWATARLLSRNKRTLRVVRYTGRYFFPGLDLRYDRLLNFLETHGFERTSVIDDMDRDLSLPLPNAYQRRAIQRAQAYGVQVVDYEPGMLEAMRAFARAVQIPHWFSPGWEEEYRHMIVAFKDGAIVGWANYSFREDFGSFGPTAVLEEHRGHGIGTWILVETMKRVKQAGLGRTWAHWTNTPFYEVNGWSICRQYAFLSKQLV